MGTPAKAPVKAPEKRSAEFPRYVLNERAYIDDKLMEIGEEVEWEGLPGHHMDPLNDAARAEKAKAPDYLDPILALTAVN
jgi:hypothetical protein